tara:strand:+ start:2049 stop:3353 length:1305 start_codon:yes stop_codon:yes gene_type:complete
MKRAAVWPLIAALLPLIITGCVTTPDPTKSQVFVPYEDLPADLAVTHRRLVQFFGEAVFNNVSDLGGRRGKILPYVIRWPAGSYLVIAGGKQLDGETSRKIVEAIPTISEATGTRLKFHPERGSGDIIIKTLPRAEIQTGNHELVSCLTQINSKFGRIVQATIFLPSDDPVMSSSCVVHELLHAMGMNGHSHTLPSVISYAHEITSLTNWDYITLAMLYRLSHPMETRGGMIMRVSDAYADILKRPGSKLHQVATSLGPALQIIGQDKTGIRFNLQNISGEPGLVFEGSFDDRPDSSMTRMFFPAKPPYQIEARLDILRSAHLSENERQFFSLRPAPDQTQTRLAKISGRLSEFNLLAPDPTPGHPRMIILTTPDIACLYFETGLRNDGAVSAEAEDGSSQGYRAAGKYCRQGGSITEQDAIQIINSIGPPPAS